MELGKWLKETREKAGLSQGEVSKKMGWTSPQFISNWERGLSTPPRDHVPKLAKMYDVNPKEFAEKIFNAKVLELKKEWAV